MPASFPHTSVRPIESWSNFHHTITGRRVAECFRPEDMPTTSASGGAHTLRRQGDAIAAVLDHCFAGGKRVTIPGSRWSLSDVLSPGDVILDPEAMTKIIEVEPSYFSAAYAARAKAGGFVPFAVQGGAKISTLNTALGRRGLALQTSGAADGHRIAGCIATGTHGAALHLGAVHDTVRAMCLVTGPKQALFLQPAARSFEPGLAKWIEAQTGIPTKDVADDELFAASQVAIGSLGFVLFVVLESEPLYELVGENVAFTIDDPRLWSVIRTLDTKPLTNRGEPFNVGLIFSPYAKAGEPAAYLNLMWKQKPSRAFASAPPVTRMMPTDTSRVVSRLIDVFDHSWSAKLVEQVVSGLVAQLFSGSSPKPLFPGEMFGHTTLPEGNGRSTEIAVPATDAERTMRAILGALRAEALSGRHLLGAAGMRFVGRSGALLGMNVHQPTAFVELASIGSEDTGLVHQACWQALRDANITFTCHWGQEYEGGMTNASLRAYYGDRIDRWHAARAEILPTAIARTVFSTPLATKLGLA